MQEELSKNADIISTFMQSQLAHEYMHEIEPQMAHIINALRPDNALRQHDTMHVVIAHALFQRYIKRYGCVQPHRQHFMKTNMKFIPLILLPINTKKKDIHALINDHLLKDGEKDIRVSAFHAM